MMKLNRFALACLACATLSAAAATAARAQGKSAQSDPLKPYASCAFDDGLEVRKSERLSSDEIYSRGVQTADGEKEVTRVAGYRMLLAYPKTDPFANVRPEKSREDAYAQDKRNVIDELKYMISTGKEMETQEPIRAAYNGFESYGLNRRTLEVGSTVGVYALFNDADRTITTVYFFNAKPKKRKFQTVEEWRTLKEHFLDNYTRCVNANAGR
jgi:hypothetical protein